MNTIDGCSLKQDSTRKTAGGGGRTLTPLREPDFESGASADFATPAFWVNMEFYGYDVKTWRAEN